MQDAAYGEINEDSLRGFRYEEHQRFGAFGLEEQRRALDIRASVTEYNVPFRGLVGVAPSSSVLTVERT